MKTVSLSGSLRENVGKKDAKKHRVEGKIPCVLYGGKEQIHFVADDKLFRKIIFTPEVYLVKLEIGGTGYDTIVQDVQYHPVTDKILHVDFLELGADKPVTIGIPVKMEGTAPGVLKGGRFIHKMRKLKVRALAKDLPEYIMISINALEIGDSVMVRDITRDGVSFLDTPNSVILGVRTARAVVEEVPAGGEVVAEEGAAAAEGGTDKKEEGKKD